MTRWIGLLFVVGVSLMSLVSADQCVDCIRTQGLRLIGHNIEALRAKCVSPACPLQAQHCDFIARHRNFTIGYLIGDQLTLKQAWLSCISANTCPVAINRQQVLLDLLSQPDDHHLHALVHTLGLSNLWVDSNQCQEASDSSSSDDDEAQTQVALKQLQSNLSLGNMGIQLGEDEDNDSRHKCFKCLKGGIKESIIRSWHHLVRVCRSQNINDPFGSCEFARNNPGFATGYIVARFHPSLPAAGACVALGVCEVRDFKYWRPVEPFAVHLGY